MRGPRRSVAAVLGSRKAASRSQITTWNLNGHTGKVRSQGYRAWGWCTAGPIVMCAGNPGRSMPRCRATSR